MMESNDDGSIFVVWGMSIASKRAKERPNRTPDELVMVKMVKLGMLKMCGAVVPLWLGGSKKLVPLGGR